MEKQIFGADMVSGRIAVMINRNEIKFLKFDHENLTYRVDETLSIELKSEFVSDSETLTLLKINDHDLYFAKSPEYHEKDFTSIVSYNRLTQEW